MATQRTTRAAKAAASGSSDAKTSDETAQDPVTDLPAAAEPETVPTPPTKELPAAAPEPAAAALPEASAGEPEDLNADEPTTEVEATHPPEYFAELARVLLDTEPTTAEAAFAGVELGQKITLTQAKTHVSEYLSRPVAFAGQILAEADPVDPEDSVDAAEATEENE